MADFEGIQQNMEGMNLEEDKLDNQVVEIENKIVTDGNVKNTIETGSDDAACEISEKDNEKPSDDTVEQLMNHKLRTISQYMTLVENRKNHVTLLKEATITGFLVLCLGDDIPEVVESSFQVFRTLSKQDENIPLLKNLCYIMDALLCVAKNNKIKDSVRREAKSLFTDLRSVSFKHPPPLSELSDSMKNVLASAASNGPPTSAVDGKEGAKSSDLNATVSTMRRKNKGRETILFVDNAVLQHKGDRARVTQVLIGVPGIISVTYDLKKNFCIIRGKRNTAPEDFGRAVASLGLANVYLVRKNENKEEVKVHIEASQQENFPYPTYPEEQENEDIDDSGAVAKLDQQTDENSSFLKSAKNFIKRSFYW